MTARYSLGDRRFEIEIFRYAYPRTVEGAVFDGALNLDFDHETTANWLDMRVLLTDGREARAARNEILMTYEVLHLIEWLEEAANGDFNLLPFSGIEMYPELETIRTPGREPFVSVTFGWSPDVENLTVSFDADPLMLRTFAAALRMEVAPFPVRSPRSLERVDPRRRGRLLRRKDQLA